MPEMQIHWQKMRRLRSSTAGLLLVGGALVVVDASTQERVGRELC